MRYDRARKNLDRHPNFILAAYMASVPEPAYVSCGSALEAPGIADERARHRRSLRQRLCRAATERN